MLEPESIFKQFLQARKDKFQLHTKGLLTTWVAEVLPPSPSSSYPSSSSTFTSIATTTKATAIASTPISISPSPFNRILGFCDVTPLRDYSHLYPLHSSPPLVPPGEATATLELLTLYIHPTAQGKGLASRMATCAVRAALTQYAHTARTTHSAHTAHTAHTVHTAHTTQRMLVITLEQNTKARAFYAKKMHGNLRGIYGGYVVGGELYNVAVFEWLDVPMWIKKWEDMYGCEDNMTL